MYNKEESLNNFYKKIAKQVNFKKASNYEEDDVAFQMMKQSQEFEADFNNGTWEDFMEQEDRLPKEVIAEDGYDSLQALKPQLEFLFTFIVHRSSQNWYRSKEDQSIIVYDDDSGIIYKYPPMSDEELEKLMILACKHNNNEHSTNKYNLTPEYRDALGLDNPDLVKDFNNLTPEEVTSLKEQFSKMLVDCKVLLQSNSLDKKNGLIYVDKLGELFADIVAGQTPAEDYMVETDQKGSQGVVELPAGQELISEFFNGNDDEWYDLCRTLINLK